jgi:hypothetical protein
MYYKDSALKIVTKDIFRSPNEALGYKKKNLHAYAQTYSVQHSKIKVAVYHCHWLSKILTNLSNPIAYLTINPLKISKKKNSDHQIQEFH